MSVDQGVNDFLRGGGARAFPFEKLGDTVEGEIISAKVRQQTSLEDGKPMYWDNGEPRNMLVVILQTTLHDDEEDDGERSIYFRGGNFTIAEGEGASSLTALRDALKRAGVKELEVGGMLKVRYSGHGPGKRGFNAAKLYRAAYKPPAKGISVDEMV